MLPCATVCNILVCAISNSATLNIHKYFNKQLCSCSVNKWRCNSPLYRVITLFLYTQWSGFGKASLHCLDPYVKYVYWSYPSPLVCIHYPVCFVRRMRCRWGTLITLHRHTSIMDPWNLVSRRKGSWDKNPFDLSRGKLIIQLLFSLCFPDNFRAIHNRLSHWDNTMASCCIIISHASHQHTTSAATKNSLDTWETVSIFLTTLLIFFLFSDDDIISKIHPLISSSCLTLDAAIHFVLILHEDCRKKVQFQEWVSLFSKLQFTYHLGKSCSGVSIHSIQQTKRQWPVRRLFRAFCSAKLSPVPDTTAAVAQKCTQICSEWNRNHFFASRVTCCCLLSTVGHWC